MEQLAAACDVSVDTVRYYQSRGLLPQPEREGRVAWYGDEHDERIREIRTLQAQGPHARGDPARGDRRAGPRGRRPRGRRGRGARGVGATRPSCSTLDAFAARSGVPASLIQAVEREGIRLGRVVDGEDRYTAGDIELVRTALRLLEFGLPLPDLLGLARDADTAMRGLAERAVELFDEHVRKPIRDTAGDDDVAADADGRGVRRAAAGGDAARSRTTSAGCCSRPRRSTSRRRPDDVGRAAASGRGEGAGRPRPVRHDRRPLRPREPRDDLRDGRRVAAARGARAPAPRSFARARPRVRHRRLLSRAASGRRTASSGSTSRTGCSLNATTEAPLVEADVLRLPVADGGADGVTCGFALRNVVSLHGLLRGARARRAARRTDRAARRERARQPRSCAPGTRSTSTGSCR